MASSSHSITLPIDEKHIPSGRLSGEERAFADLMNNAGEERMVYQQSKRCYVQVFLYDFCTVYGIRGVGYTYRLQTTLGPREIQGAIEGFSKMLEFFQDRPEETSAFLDGALFAMELKEALRLDDDELGELFDYEGVNFYCVLSFVRMQLSVLKDAALANQHVFHLLLGCDEAWEAWLHARIPPEPRYPADFLASIEGMLMQGIDASTLPLPCPAPRSMVFAQASAWYLSALAQLPALTAGWQEQGSRGDAVRHLSRDLRTAAMMSLVDTHLAPEFFRKHPLPADEGVD